MAASGVKTTTVETVKWSWGCRFEVELLIMEPALVFNTKHEDKEGKLIKIHEENVKGKEKAISVL